MKNRTKISPYLSKKERMAILRGKRENRILDPSKGGTGTRLNMAKSMFMKTAVAAICIKDSGRATPVNLISRPKMVAMTMFEAGPATATMASPHL